MKASLPPPPQPGKYKLTLPSSSSVASTISNIHQHQHLQYQPTPTSAPYHDVIDDDIDEDEEGENDDDEDDEDDTSSYSSGASSSTPQSINHNHNHHHMNNASRNLEPPSILSSRVPASHPLPHPHLHHTTGGFSPAELISSEFIGWKHDAKRYGAAILQLVVFTAWMIIGVCFGLWFTIWVDTDRPTEIWADILRAASIFMFPTVVCLFIAFAFFPYTGINPKRITDWDTPLYFRWTTRGTNPNLVRNVISKSYDAIHKFGNFFIEVCTECSIDVPNYTTVDPSFYRDIVLPKEYEAPLGSKFKARALHYGALNSHAPADAYIVHLDEESVVTEELLLGIREFISHNKGYIGQGIITYARESKGWQSWVAWIMDAVRVGDDYGRFRMQFLIGRVLVGMKGSFMVVPNQMELESGFDHGPHSSITEDAWFAFCYVNKIRFCPGRLVEQSPFNLMDVVKQRRRWASGLWKVVFHHPTPWYNKIIITFQMITWLTAPLNAVSVLCGFALSNYKASIMLSVYNGIVFGMFNFQYWWGVLNLRSSSVSEKVCALIAVPFILPFFIVIEGAAGYLGTFLPPKGFELVQKEQTPLPMPPKKVVDDDKYAQFQPLLNASNEYLERSASVNSRAAMGTPTKSNSSDTFLTGPAPFFHHFDDVGRNRTPSVATFASKAPSSVGRVPSIHRRMDVVSTDQVTLASVTHNNDTATGSLSPTPSPEKRAGDMVDVSMAAAVSLREEPTVRELHLDGFRGFAALVVVAWHLVDYTFADVYPDVTFGKAKIFWSPWALYIFFIITGRVLSTRWIKSCKQVNPNFVRFSNAVFRRVFRLLLPTFIVLLLQWVFGYYGWYADADYVFYSIMGTLQRTTPNWMSIGDNFWTVCKFALQMLSGNVQSGVLLDLSASMWAMWAAYVGSMAVFFMLATYPFIQGRKWVFMLLALVYFYWIQSLITVFLVGIIMAELHRMGMFSNIYTWPKFWNYFWTLGMLGLFVGCYWSPWADFLLNNWFSRFYATPEAWLTPANTYLITAQFPMQDVVAAIIMYIVLEGSVVFRAVFSFTPFVWLGQISLGVYLLHEFLVQIFTVRVIKNLYDNGYTSYSGLTAIFWFATLGMTLLCASLFKVAIEDRLNIFLPWLYAFLFVKPWSFKHFDRAVVDHLKAFPRVFVRWCLDVVTLGYFSYVREMLAAKRATAARDALAESVAAAEGIEAGAVGAGGSGWKTVRTVV